MAPGVSIRAKYSGALPKDFVIATYAAGYSAQADRSPRFGRRGRSRRENPLVMAVYRYPRLEPDSVQVVVHARIGSRDLVFVKSPAGFVANYEFTVFVSDESEGLVATRISRHSIIEPVYERTRSPRVTHHSSSELNLVAGEYTVLVLVEDLENRQVYRQEEDLEISAPPDHGLVISDLVLLGREGVKDETRTSQLPPDLGNTIPELGETFQIRYVVRVSADGDTIGYVQYVLKGKKDEAAASYADTLQLSGQLSTHVASIPKAALAERSYTLEAHLTVGKDTAERSRTIRIGWRGVSDFIDEVDEAIRQTRYISTKLLKQTRGADEDEKRKALLEFWEERNPNPGAESNELMNEYYRRVRYSNENFSNYRPGWENDFGMVHIIYGLPDEIERQPYPYDQRQRPYEVWHYVDANRRFVFVDVNSFGDYRLVTPLYPH